MTLPPGLETCGVGVRACRRVSRPACGGPRIRRMRDIPLRRNTAFAGCPRPGGADGRPAVRKPLGRASAPVNPPRYTPLRGCLLRRKLNACTYPAAA